MINMLEVKAIKEIAKSATEIKQKTQAFENSGKDIKSVRKLDTINEKLEGKTNPVTGVKYQKRRFMLNGEKVEGVFPVFESKFDIKLPKNLYQASDDAQIKYCTKQLADYLKNNPKMVKQFDQRQLEQIKNGEPKIANLTWHHNEIPGKMQLVDSTIHNESRHTGGRCIWGGGKECR